MTQKGGVDRWGEKTQLGDRGERQEASLKNIRMHNLTQTIISIECAVSNFTGHPPFPSPPTTIACNTLSLQADNLDSASRPTRMFPTIAVKFKCNMLSRLNTNDNQSHSTSRTLVHIICSFFLSLFCPSTLLYVSQCDMGVPVRLHSALSILGPGGGWGNSCKVEHGQFGRVPCTTILCWTPCIYSMIPKGTASKGRPESSQPHVGVTKSS